MKASARQKKIILFICIALGLLFLILSAARREEGQTQSTGEYVSALEDKLESFLKKTSGIREVHVFVTLEEGSEYIYSRSSGSLFSGTNGDVLVKEVTPKIRGVAVACTGGDAFETERRITELVSRALGIPTNKIKVVGVKQA